MLENYYIELYLLKRDGAIGLQEILRGSTFSSVQVVSLRQTKLYCENFCIYMSIILLYLIITLDCEDNNYKSVEGQIIILLYLIITLGCECNNYESVEGQDQAIYRCLLATTKMSDAICSILIILLSDLFKETISVISDIS